MVAEVVGHHVHHTLLGLLNKLRVCGKCLDQANESGIWWEYSGGFESLVDIKRLLGLAGVGELVDDAGEGDSFGFVFVVVGLGGEEPDRGTSEKGGR